MSFTVISKGPAVQDASDQQGQYRVIAVGNGKKAAYKHPSGIPTTNEERENLEAPYGLPSTLSQHPLQVLGHLPVDFFRGLEKPGRLISSGEFESPISDYLDELIGFNELSPESQQNANLGSLVVQALAPFVGKGISNLKGEWPTHLPWNKATQAGEAASEIARLPGPVSTGSGSSAESAGASFSKAANEGITGLKEAVFGRSADKKFSDILSNAPLESTTKAGMEIEREVSKIFKDIYENENKLYAKVRNLTKGIESIDQKYIDDIRNILPEMEEIEKSSQSGPFKRFIEVAKGQIAQGAELDSDGNIIGYKPVKISTKLDTIKELNKIPNSDFPVDSAKGVFKLFGNWLRESIQRGLADHPEASEALKKANAAHAERSSLFESKDVSDWVSPSRGSSQAKNFSSDYKSLISSPDKIRKIKPILERSEDGRNLLLKIQKEIATAELSPYTNLAGRFEKEKISEVLRELEYVLEPEQIKSIENAFEASRTPVGKAANVFVDIYNSFKRPSKAIKSIKNID